MSREHTQPEKSSSSNNKHNIVPQEIAPEASRPFKDILNLQRTVGNSTTQRLIADGHVQVHHNTPQIIARKSTLIQREGGADTTTDAEVLHFQGFEIRKQGDVVPVIKHFKKKLSAQQAELAENHVAEPQELDNAFIASDNMIEVYSETPEEAVTPGTGLMMAMWWNDAYVDGMNACEAAKASAAARNLRKVKDKLARSKAEVNKLEPELREAQRAAFRAGDDNMLLKIADTFATILDTTLTLDTTIIAIGNDMAALQNMANVAKGYSGVYPTINTKVTMIVKLATEVNKVFAAFQLLRAAIDQITGKKTEMGEVSSAISGMSTIASAGGTLLGASASFSLYANLYLGPMTNACLQMLDKLTDLRSKTHNRGMIQLGHFNLVNWSIEPGGRPMFDFMLTVMHGSGPGDVPSPVPDAVASYFVDNEGDFEAGSKSDLPTTGWWLWEDVDDAKIASWVYYNRADLWGMLYGDCPVP